MKIDYIVDIESDELAESMLRITSFSKQEVSQLIVYLTKLSNGTVKEFESQNLNFIEPTNINIKFVFDTKGRGLFKENDNLFICELNHAGFERMICLLKPFEKNINGYQFLLDPVDKIELLISYGGGW